MIISGWNILFIDCNIILNKSGISLNNKLKNIINERKNWNIEINFIPHNLLKIIVKVVINLNFPFKIRNWFKSITQEVWNEILPELIIRVLNQWLLLKNNVRAFLINILKLLSSIEINKKKLTF